MADYIGPTITCAAHGWDITHMGGCPRCETPHPPPVAETSDAVRADDSYVAWMRYKHWPDGGPTTIHLCDSDADGAFRVYRHSDKAVGEMNRALAEAEMAGHDADALEMDRDRLDVELAGAIACVTALQKYRDLLAERCDRLEEMVRVVEWVRQAAGSKYACPWCHGITERDGGPGHMDDCPWLVVVERRAHAPKVTA